MIDLSLPDDVRAAVARLEEFIAHEVAPAETGITEADITSGAIEREVLPALRAAARRAGVYAPQLPPDWGGQGLGPTTLALLAERCGPHPLAALALNCAAPDEANLHMLLHFGTPEQQQRWLRPLADGAIRSCFGMTEPDAGSDPRRISSTAVPEPDGHWRINAHKLFTTGAIGAAFCIVMAVSEPDAPPGRGISMFIVPLDAPGFEVVRDLPTMGFATVGGHPEIALREVVVGPEALLGGRGHGFAMAQARLGVGRLGHAMRWIGIAQRALDLAARHALGRETFGAPLADRQTVQWWLADGATTLHAARLMVLEACWRIERGIPHATQVSMVKTFTAEALGEIVDRALHGLGDLGRRDGYVQRQLRRWWRQWEDSRTRDQPLAGELHRRLTASAPPQPRTGIVHGDFRLDNVIVDRDGEVRAVLDWELCTLGDPLADLGSTLAYWVEPSEQPYRRLSSLTACPGFPSRDALLRRYAEVAGGPVDHAGFYTALGRWKIAIILEGVYARYAAGAMGSAGNDLVDLLHDADLLFRRALDELDRTA